MATMYLPSSTVDMHIDLEALSQAWKSFHLSKGTGPDGSSALQSWNMGDCLVRPLKGGK